MKNTSHILRLLFIGLVLASVVFGGLTETPILAPNDAADYYNIDGTDQAGTIIVQTASTWEVQEQLALFTFGTEKTGNYIVILDSQNAETTREFIKAVSLTSTGFTIAARNNPLEPSTTYEVNYLVVER